MIGPVSETGKVMLSSLQGAMAKGMPVDQAITYVKSMAQQGVAPLVDLYALLKQFERMKQPPAPPPQGGTVKDQLNSLESAVVNQGLGGMRPGAMSAAPQMPPEMQGLASLNAGAMENPQGFAGGGIVAFAAGGQPEERKPITPELYTRPQLAQSYEELARRDLEARMKFETPEGREAYEKELDEEMKRRQLGKYAPSLGLREAYAARKGKEAEALGAEEAALDREAFYADIAGTDQPDFLSAFAKAQAKKVERKRTTKEKVAAAKDKAEELKILRQEAREALTNKDYEAYEAKKKEIKDLEKTSTEKYVTAKEAEKAQERAASRALNLARTQTDTPVKRVQDQLTKTPQYLRDGTPNPRYGELRRLLNDMQSGKGGANRQEIAYRKNIYDKAMAALKEAQKAEEIYSNEDTAAKLEAAQKAAEKARIAYEAASLGDAFSETTVDTGLGADFDPTTAPGWSVDTP